MTKFAGDVAIYMILAVIPNEYLQQVGDAFVNSFSVLGNVARYFGYGKQVDQIAELWKKSKSVINNPACESLIKKWSEWVGVLDFNVGMKLLEKLLIKMFPNAEKEINVLMATISTANLANEPLGSIDTILNIMLSISKGNMPNPEDLMKFF